MHYMAVSYPTKCLPTTLMAEPYNAARCDRHTIDTHPHACAAIHSRIPMTVPAALLQHQQPQPTPLLRLTPRLRRATPI